MKRLLFLSSLWLLAAVPCHAHAVVDIDVRFVAPELMPAGATVPIDVIVNALSFDPAYGVTVTILVPDARLVSSDFAWRCTTTSSQIKCSSAADVTTGELPQGPHPIRIEVRVPANAQTVQGRASVESFGSFDPNDQNNVAILSSTVFDPTRCQQAAPQLTAPLQWTAAAGASGYDVFYGIDGETPHFIVTTATTSPFFNVPGGDVVWYVRARFEGCPSVESARSSFTSDNAPLKLAVGPAWTTGLVRPLSAAMYSGKVLIADAGTKKLMLYDPAAPSFTAFTLFGDIVDSPPALDGGITVGPGDNLYDADRSTHTVRFADTTRYMFMAAGQPRASGSVDGAGVGVRFDAPSAVAIDARGVFVIVDSAANVVRSMKYSSTRFDFIVTTLAKGFNDPAGVALDTASNAYVTDRGNHAIRKVTPDGTVSTLAGTIGVSGHRDGFDALFDRPYGIAFDPWGNLYVTEEGNHDIRKIAPNGRVTTVASGFIIPAQLTIAADGTLWIPDAGNGTLYQAAPSMTGRRRAVRR